MSAERSAACLRQPEPLSGQPSKHLLPDGGNIGQAAMLATHIAHSHILEFGGRQRNPSVTLKVAIACGPLRELFSMLPQPPKTLIKFQSEQRFLS
jgi:hypothetical protein